MCVGHTEPRVPLSEEHVPVRWVLPVPHVRPLHAQLSLVLGIQRPIHVYVALGSQETCARPLHANTVVHSTSPYLNASARPDIRV